MCKSETMFTKNLTCYFVFLEARQRGQFPLKVYGYSEYLEDVRSPSTASTIIITPPEVMSPEGEQMLSTPPPMPDPSTKAPFNLKFPSLRRQTNIPQRVYSPSHPIPSSSVIPPPFDATSYSPGRRSFYTTTTPGTSPDLMSQLDDAAERDEWIKKEIPGPTDEEILFDDEEETDETFWSPMLTFFSDSQVGQLILGSGVTTSLLATLRLSIDYLLNHYSFPPWLRRGLKMVVQFIPPNLSALLKFLRKTFKYNPVPQVDIILLLLLNLDKENLEDINYLKVKINYIG